MTRYADGFNIQVLHENLQNVIEKHHLEEGGLVGVYYNVFTTPDYIIKINSDSFIIRSIRMCLHDSNFVKIFPTPEFCSSVNTYLQNNKIVIRNRVLLKTMMVQNFLQGDNCVLRTPIYYENCVFLKEDRYRDVLKNYCKNCEFV